MDVISSPGGAGGVLQPLKPPALRASNWERILKSMSQLIPYFSVSCSGQAGRYRLQGFCLSALGGAAVGTAQRKH